MPIGTLVNVAAVLVGTTIGALAGPRLPGRVRTTVLASLGLATFAIGTRETLATDEFPLVLAALLTGAVIGEFIDIERWLTRLGDALQRRFAGHSGDPVIDVEAPELAEPAVHTSRFSEGFVIASLVFCVGPLTIVGSIQDGLGDPELLLVKSGLDGFASIAFAAVYGWGVGLAALTVVVIQGGLALGSPATITLREIP